MSIRTPSLRKGTIALALWIAACWLAAPIATRADPTYSVTPVNEGWDRLEIVDPALPKTATKAERERYIHDVLFPRVRADAAAGQEPEVWEIGFFYLNGWGVATDLEKAEAAFRLGLEREHGEGAWRLACTYAWKISGERATAAQREEYTAKADELERAALGANFTRAATSAAYLASSYLYGWWGVRRDPAKAESLLAAIRDVAPANPIYLLALAELRQTEGRPADAFENATAALPFLKKMRNASHANSEYGIGATVRCVSALAIGRISELKPEELIAFVNYPSNGSYLALTAKAEPLLSAVGKSAPDNLHYLLMMAKLCRNLHRDAEAFDFLMRALPQLKTRPDSAGFSSFYSRTKLEAFAAGAKSGKLSELKMDELLELMPQMPPAWGWVILGGHVLFLAGMVWWTYATRARGPGLWLSICWIFTASLGAGIGFFLPWPELKTQAGVWIGAVMVALACLACVWCCGRERYFGGQAIFPGPKSWLKISGLFIGLLAAVMLINAGYSVVYRAITGHALAPQIDVALLNSHTTFQLGVTLLAAALAIPFYEEVVFRGFLFSALDRRWGERWAVGLSAIVFGLLHGLDYAPVLTFFGVALGWLRLRGGGLRQSIALHGVNNALAVVVIHYYSKGSL